MRRTILAGHNGETAEGELMEAASPRERLLRLARHLEAFESPDFSFGDWEPSRTDDAGDSVMGRWNQPSSPAC
jgi:hypothetical protein